MRKLISLIILSEFISLNAFGLDPTKRITQYVHEVWTSDQGLPQNTVDAIAQTTDGYLWLGTREGLVRFDGVRFTLFDKTNTPLKSQNIKDLFEDRDQTLWIATEGGGLYSFRNGSFKNYNAQTGLLSNHVTSIYQDSNGRLLFGTSAGLNRFEHGKFTRFTANDGLSNHHILTVFEDREKNLWVATQGGGLNRLKDGKLTAYTVRDGLLSDIVYSIHQDRHGILWVGTHAGLNYFQDQKFYAYAAAPGSLNESIYCIREDRDGNLWLGTRGKGLALLRNKRYTHFAAPEGLSSNFVREMFEDREGSLWVGTSGGGLNRLRDGAVTTYTSMEGLSHDYALAIFEDRQGVLWVGTRENGLNRFDDNKIVVYTTKDGLSSNYVSSIREDRQGNLWIGTRGGGLNQMKAGKFITLGTKNGLSNEMVICTYEDLEGALWVATFGGGLNHLKNGRFTFPEITRKIAKDNIWSIHQDRSGMLWIATSSLGLVCIRDDKIQTFTSKEGLLDNFVTSIYEDAEGSLWIGTRSGLNCFRDGKFRGYTTKNGLFNDKIFWILEDDFENLWMSCNKGIFRVNKKEFDDFDLGKIKQLHSVSYGKADGMKSQECNRGNPAGWKRKDGTLWFPTLKGVVKIDPRNIQINRIPPPVIIEKVVVDDNIIHAYEGNRSEAAVTKLPPGKEKFEFHYTALSFPIPERVRFKYKIDGLDKDWVGAGNRRIAYYTNISPGSYVFRVKACNNDGIWNEAGTVFSFYLRPHFYQTLWFYFLCSIAVVLFAWQIHRYRLKRLLAIEKIRTRIATDLHDDIGSGLTQIAILSEVIEHRIKQKEPEITETLAKIAGTSRNLIDSMSDLVWSVNPARDSAEDLVQRMRRFTSDLLGPQNIHTQFEIQGIVMGHTLGPDVRRHVYLVFKEIMHNIVRHSHSSSVDIRIRIDRSGLLLIVKDNGRGFDPTDKSQGHGLTNMRERARLLGGTLEVLSGRGTGTTVSLQIPLR